MRSNEPDSFDKMHGQLLQNRQPKRDSLSDKMGRGAQFLLRIIFRTIAAVILVAIAIKIVNAWILDSDQRASDAAAQEFYMRNVATPEQKAANAHFNKCAQYRARGSAYWSDQQKYYALLGEGCHSDDRDDPRYPDATYPYNNLKPWPHVLD
jgi:type II secretory pathway component PulL